MTPRRITIFLGTAPQPFPSIIAWADARQAAHPDEVVLVQYGASEPPTVAEGVAYVAPEELGALATEADIVITHGGPGTIMDVRSGGHRPIVLPRNPARQEMVDDHQMRFTAWAASKGLIHRAVEPAEIDAYITKLGTTRDASTDTSHSTAETAERLERLIASFDRSRLPTADAATAVLLVTGDRLERRRLLQHLAERGDVALLGSASSVLLAPAGATAQCSCGLPATECSFWTAVVTEAFDGWQGIDRVEVSRLEASFRSARMSAAVSRRRPRPRIRRDLIAYSDHFRRLYDAARHQAAVPLLVDSAPSPLLAVALSHNRHIDLRVAAVGASEVRDRLLQRAVAYRRVPTARLERSELLDDPRAVATAVAPVLVAPTTLAVAPTFGAGAHHMLNDLELDS